MIPLVNLKRQYSTLKAEMLETIDQVLESTNYIQSKFVEKFEKEFSVMQGVKHALACSNGTTAIELALKALGVGPGDEVITTPFTFIATVEGIMAVGAKPVFVDIDRDTYQIDVTKIEAAITSKTRAIMPVHLYGNVCDMNAIMSIARQRNLKVVEDCAQAHLAKQGDQFVATFGEASTFSFYPGKNLGAYGDAGMVCFDRAENKDKARQFLDHGRLGKKYEHDSVGTNYRADDLQAAILSVKLKYLKSWTESRRKIASSYDAHFDSLGIKRMKVTKNAYAVYHLYPIELDDRNSAMEMLKNKGVSTGIHYPIPLHLQPALKSLGHAKGDFPNSEAASQKVLSLPICGDLNASELEKILQETKIL